MYNRKPGQNTNRLKAYLAAALVSDVHTGPPAPKVKNVIELAMDAARAGDSSSSSSKQDATPTVSKFTCLKKSCSWDACSAVEAFEEAQSSPCMTQQTHGGGGDRGHANNVDESKTSNAGHLA